MSEQGQGVTQVPVENPTRSPLYRAVYANHFYYRITGSDFTITFGSLSDASSPAGTGIIVDGSITISWPTLKVVAEQLIETVKAIEEVVGPIKTPASSRMAAETPYVIRNIVHSFQIS